MPSLFSPLKQALAKTAQFYSNTSKTKWMLGGLVTLQLTSAVFTLGAVTFSAAMFAAVVSCNAVLVGLSFSIYTEGFAKVAQSISSFCQNVFSMVLKTEAQLTFSIFGNIDFILSAKEGYTGRLERLIQVGANVNAVDENGSTALMWAAQEGHAGSVTTLLANGADVNIANVSGSTALMYAIGSGNANIVTQVLDAGADINAAEIDGYTALMYAVSQGNVNIVTQVLEAGADIHAADIDGNTAGMMAAEKGDYPLLEIIIQHGGAVNALNGAQSVHEISVHHSVSDSIAALKKHYSSANLQQARAEFITWVNGLTQTDSKAKAAKRAIEWLQNLDFTDERSKVTMKEALALVWLGINDVDAMQPDLKLKKEDMPARQKTLIHQLNEIQRGYNINNKDIDNQAPDDKTCPSGAFNKLVASLAGAHSKVKLVVINVESMSLKAQGLANDAFMQLNETFQRKYANEWSSASGMPEGLLNLITDTVATKLHEEFDEFRDLVNNYDAAFKIALENLEYTNPTGPVKALQKKMEQELKEAAEVPPHAPALIFSSSVVLVENNNHRPEQAPLIEGHKAILSL